MKDKNQNHAYCSTIGFIPMSLTLHSSDMPLSKYNKIVLKMTNIYKNIKIKAYLKKDKIQKHTYNNYSIRRTFPVDLLLHSMLTLYRFLIKLYTLYLSLQYFIIYVFFPIITKG